MASGGLHGLSRKSEGETEILTTADGLASDDVRLIFEDRNHDIWLGTISGLQRLHHGVFVTYRAADGVSNDHSQVDAVFQQKDGSIWAGTLEGGVAELRQRHWKRFGASEGLSPGQVRGLIQDATSPAIAISDYGIFALRGDRYSRLPSIPHGYIYSPVRTPDGSLWFGVEHQGLFRLKGTQLIHPGPADGVFSDDIWSLSVDAAGVLWVGEGDRLLRWNQSRFDTALTLPGPVLTIAWPRSGEMVLGSLNGLFLRMGQSARTLTQREGLPGNTVLDVIDDGGGNLWIATTLAIAKTTAGAVESICRRQDKSRSSPDFYCRGWHQKQFCAAVEPGDRDACTRWTHLVCDRRRSFCCRSQPGFCTTRARHPRFNCCR